MAEDAYTVAQDMPARAAAEFCVPFHYIVHAEAGTMRMEADGHRWTLPPARAGLVAAGYSIVATLPRPIRICSALIAPRLVPSPPQALSVFEMSPLARELLSSLRNVSKETPLDSRTNALFIALAAEIWRLSERPTAAVMPVPASERVRKAFDLTETRLDEPLRFTDVATVVALSPRALARRIKDETGLTWRDAQRRLRMIRAMELLSETASPVTDIALDVGYASPSAFNAAFRAFAGQSPTDFRRTGQGK